VSVYLPELAARLNRLVPAELAAGNWDDVVRRAHAPARAQRRLFTLRVAIAFVLVLLLAGVATATYFIARLEASRARPTPGALTVAAGGYNAAAVFAEVLPRGRLRVVWRCPDNVFCGELTSVDWASDGRHVAFTLDEIGGRSAYVGLHILDVKTGRDIHIPSVPLAHPMAPQPNSVFASMQRQELRRLGCVFPTDVAWSPDGRRLAYACASGFGSDARAEIFTIRSDGTRKRRLATGLAEVAWPTWSPDGRRIALSGSPRRGGTSSIYVITLSGSGRALVARDGSAPDWSPTSNVIAYRSRDGIRLVTSAGNDVTPNHTHPIAPKGGAPAWSPDGTALAVGTQRGVYVVEAGGGGLKRVLRQDGGGAFGSIRPAWYPGGRSPKFHEPNHHPRASSPSTCGEC
jgi:WD40-like Beta Propeller Repeat